MTQKDSLAKTDEEKLLHTTGFVNFLENKTQQHTMYLLNMLFTQHLLFVKYGARVYF